MHSRAVSLYRKMQGPRIIPEYLSPLTKRKHQKMERKQKKKGNSLLCFLLSFSFRPTPFFPSLVWRIWWRQDEKFLALLGGVGNISLSTWPMFFTWLVPPSSRLYEGPHQVNECEKRENVPRLFSSAALIKRERKPHVPTGKESGRVRQPQTILYYSSFRLLDPKVSAPVETRGFLLDFVVGILLEIPDAIEFFPAGTVTDVYSNTIFSNRVKLSKFFLLHACRFHGTRAPIYFYI